MMKDDCALCMKTKEFVFWKGGKYIIAAVMLRKNVIELGDGRYTVGGEARHMCELLSKEGKPCVTVPCAEVMTEHQTHGGYYDAS